MKIAILGASGLVGTHLAHRLAGRDYALKLFIHSSGNAWQLAPLGLPLHQLNLLDRAALKTALADCSHVVNCTRGDEELMLKGMANLIEVCGEHGGQHLIHLSSTLVYGDPPAPESVSENAATHAPPASYAWQKLRQDQMLMAATELRHTILCPPNISGVQSYYWLQILGALRQGEFALTTDPRRHSVTVDVQNLCLAIECALNSRSSHRGRIYITDGEPLSWHQLIAGLSELVGVDPAALPRLPAQEPALTDSPPRATLWRSLKHLASSHVREALRKDPNWAKLDQGMRLCVARLGAGTENRLRTALEGPTVVPRTEARPINRTSYHQYRAVVPDISLAQRELAYRPEVSAARSLATFMTWYRHETGLDQDYAPLVQALYN